MGTFLKIFFGGVLFIALVMIVVLIIIWVPMQILNYFEVVDYRQLIYFCIMVPWMSFVFTVIFFIADELD
jgi:hypothetical protein